MKVLLISHTCQSRSEGQPKAVELARLGIELTVVVPRRWKHYGQWRSAQNPEPNAGFRWLPMTVQFPWSGPGQSYLHFYPGLADLICRMQPDVIDLWEEPWSLVSAQTCFLRDRFCPLARIVSETEQNVEKRLVPPFENFRSHVLKRADFVVGRSEEALQIVRRKGFDGPTRVVPNAVDAEIFQPLSDEERTAARAEFGWQDDECVAAYVGRLVEEKGLSDLVEAASQTQSRLRVILVGNGAFEGDLRAQIAKLGLEKRVEIWPARGRVELARLMGALDVLVLPSRTTARWKEQFGRVLIEASACAVPVIGSSSGAIPDVVGEGGLVFPEGDTTILAQQLDYFAAHPAKARALGARGRELVEEKFTWARVAQAMAQIYRDCSGLN